MYKRSPLMGSKYRNATVMGADLMWFPLKTLPDLIPQLQQAYNVKTDGFLGGEKPQNKGPTHLLDQQGLTV